MRIEYSPIAVRDLERVWAEVFEASAIEETATKYIDDLMNQISAKQDFPKSGAPLYYEGLFTGFYFVTFKSYMVFYKVETDRMLVSRVVYGKSDYMRTIFRNAHEAIMPAFFFVIHHRRIFKSKNLYHTAGIMV